MLSKILSAICLNLDQSKILSSGNGLRQQNFRPGHNECAKYRFFSQRFTGFEDRGVGVTGSLHSHAYFILRFDDIHCDRAPPGSLSGEGIGLMTWWL